jgi:hypothetical protein
MFPFATPRVARGFQSKHLKGLIPFLKNQNRCQVFSKTLERWAKEKPLSERVVEIIPIGATNRYKDDK